MDSSDSLPKKPSNERIIDQLIEIVISDKNGRDEALVSLKKIGDPRAIDYFVKMLNNQSPKNRAISIDALGELGDLSTISPLANLINMNDLSPNGKRTNFGHSENITLAKEAIRKIQRRFHQRSNEPIKISENSPITKYSSPLNGGVNWTDDDIQLLKQLWSEGKSIQIIVMQLKMSPEGVVHKLIEIGLIGYNDDYCDPKPAHFGFTWSDQEITQLSSELKAGKRIPEIANIHQRNRNSVLHTMVKFNLMNYNRRDLLEQYIEDSASLNHNQLIYTLISELKINNSIDAKNYAATQLGHIRDPYVVNELIKSVNNDPGVRYRALLSLKRIGDPTAIPIFIERLQDPSAKIRLVSVTALGEIGDSTVVKYLEDLVNSNDYQNSLKYGGNSEIIQAACDAIQNISLKDSPHKNETLEVEKPEIELSLDLTQLSAEKWHKLGLTLTNTGAFPVENVTLTFSDEFKTIGIKPISVKAGQFSHMDISIYTNTVGNIILEIILKYKDREGREYRELKGFWIDVLEKGTPTSTPIETAPLPSSPFTPRSFTLKQLPPDLTDRYSESEFIGKGGFAYVFRAKRKDGKSVAVKVPISMDATTGKAFVAEIQNWTKLNHKNIVRIYDFNIMPIPYFEMELCDSSLAELKKPIESEEAAWILFNICEGLKFTHAQKIIHRDLKPQNILIREGTPKISDWGLSRVITESSASIATSFTPHYAAPEQINNRFKDERTDIWQIGVILYELVTGELPFNGDSMIEIGMNIATKDPMPPGEKKPDAKVIESVVMKCLEKEPTKRYQTILELQKDLAMYLRQNYGELLKKSVSLQDSTKSAYYCGDLVMINMLTGEIATAYKYLLDLVHYSKGDVKVEAQELSEQLKMRMEMGVTEIPAELLQKADLIVYQVSTGFRNKR